MRVLLIGAREAPEGFRAAPMPDEVLDYWGRCYERHSELHGVPFGEFLRRPGELTKALVLERLGRRSLLPRQRAAQAAADRAQPLTVREVPA